MAPQPEQSAVRQPSGGAMIPTLYGMAMVVGAVTVVAILFELASALNRNEPVGAGSVVNLLLVGVAGLAGALLLAAMGVLLTLLQGISQMAGRLTRSQEDCATQLSRLASSGPVVPSIPAPPQETAQAGLDVVRLEQIVEILGELSENLLLTPEQRQAKRQQQTADVRRQLADTLARLLADGNFIEAQRRLDEYGRLCPDQRSQVEQFQAQIDEARAQHEEADYQAALARTRDLMGQAAWDRAEDVAREALARQPRSQRIRELAEMVRQERAKFEAQQRQLALGQIEQLASQKQWREAHRLASDLLARHPNSPEARIVQEKMATLRDNAEIQTRREMEEQFKEHVKAHRYIEALALAQEVLSKYPGSPQAKVLREQMPQLTSKAKMQMDQVGKG